VVVGRLIVHILLIVGCSAFTAAQQDPMRLKLAQSFEQAGDWERAAALYEALYQSDPSNYVYFDGLRRSYMNLKRYEKAIQLIERRLEVSPSDQMLKASLAGVYYQSGYETAADSIWFLVLKSDPKNANLYRLVAAQMIELRLYDKAIATYIRAREAVGNQRLFAEELASLYGALQQYEAATQEYVKILLTSPQQLSFIQSRIASFTIRKEATQAALRVVQEEVRRSPENTSLRSLLAWLMMERQDFQGAYQEYRIIDRATKQNGAEIFNFGQRAFQEQAYAVAAKAFKEVVDQFQNQPRRPHAKFWYVRSLEEISATTDSLVPATERQTIPASEARPSYGGTIALYEQLAAEYPTSDIASQALMRIGIIKRQRFGDLDGAREAFEEVRKLNVNSVTVLEATFHIGEILVSKNELDSAKKELKSILLRSPEAFRDRAQFAIAEIDYFRGALDSALTRLELLAGNAGTDLANDALQLQYFILENRSTAPAALADFARAELLMRQHRHSEALTHFQVLIKKYPSALLVDDAVLKIAEIQTILGRPLEALASYQTVVNDMPTSIVRDRAQMKIAELYETKLKDKQKAIETYEQLLAKFPTSLYAEEARKRIRQLRGDAI
jgi:tetratricopeptide (TPR) repeat protein